MVTARIILLVAVVILPLLGGCRWVGVDRLDEHGTTALMRAVRAGDEAGVRRLIERGADVDAVVPTRDFREFVAFLSWMQSLPESDIHYTPLKYAAAGGHVGIARILLEAGADVHHEGRAGTALDVAAHRRDPAMVDLLLRHGARATPRHVAAAVNTRAPEVLERLLRAGVSPDAAPALPRHMGGPAGAPPIILAAQTGDTAALRILIAAGADVNVRDANGWSVLRWARRARSGRWGAPDSAAVIALLTRAGASDAAGALDEALLAAVTRDDSLEVGRLLRSGARANARDDRGVPVLVTAARRGDLAIVDALIAAGADVNARPRHDATPLINAIQGGNLAVVKRLVDAGARVDLADGLRRTPLEVASGWRRTEITAFLLERAAPADPSSLAIAALNGDVEQVRLLVRRVPPAGKVGAHALAEAARGCTRRDNTEVLKLLLAAGADPRVSDEMNFTVLHRAAGLCPPAAVRALLAAGADPNARDWNGYTPLMGAAFDGNLETVELLMASRADVNARTNDGKSVLAHAERHPGVQQVLRRAGAR